MGLVVSFRMNIDSVDAELERLQHPPVAKLEGVLAANYATTEARVHVLTGALLGSGHPKSDFSSDVWTGTISFDRYPGIYELARGPKKTSRHGGLTDSHFFFDPVEERYPADWTSGDSYQMYTKVIEEFLGMP